MNIYVFFWYVSALLEVYTIVFEYDSSMYLSFAPVVVGEIQTPQNMTKSSPQVVLVHVITY